MGWLLTTKTTAVAVAVEVEVEVDVAMVMLLVAGLPPPQERGKTRPPRRPGHRPMVVARRLTLTKPGPVSDPHLQRNEVNRQSVSWWRW